MDMNGGVKGPANIFVLLLFLGSVISIRPSHAWSGLRFRRPRSKDSFSLPLSPTCTIAMNFSRLGSQRLASLWRASICASLLKMTGMHSLLYRSPLPTTSLSNWRPIGASPTSPPSGSTSPPRRSPRREENVVKKNLSSTTRKKKIVRLRSNIPRNPYYPWHCQVEEQRRYVLLTNERNFPKSMT